MRALTVIIFDALSFILPGDPHAGVAPVQAFSRRHSSSPQTAHRSIGPWNFSIHELRLPVSLLSPWLRKEGVSAQDRLWFPKSLTAVQCVIRLYKRTELKDTAACPDCFWQFKLWNTITAEEKKTESYTTGPIQLSALEVHMSMLRSITLWKAAAPCCVVAAQRADVSFDMS